MENWRQVWRETFAKILPVKGLEALLKALQTDDPRLIQNATTSPPPLMCVSDWPVEAACALGFCGWQGAELDTVGEVELFFAQMCFEADKILGEAAGMRWFLNWFDDAPREEMRRELSAEIELALAARPQVIEAIAGAPIEAGQLLARRPDGNVVMAITASVEADRPCMVDTF